jgi:PAS domain S-box-containing protein
MNPDVSPSEPNFPPPGEEFFPLSRERLQLVLGAIDVGLWQCDLPFDRLTWNTTCKAHFGLPANADVTIETFYARLHPDDRQPTRDAIERAIAERTDYDVEYRTVADDGRVRWIRAIGRPFYDASGTPHRFDGITVDLTDRRRAEEQAREEAALIEAINQVGRALAAELDLQKLVQAITDAATDLTGAQFGAFFYNVLNEQGESYVLYTLSGAPRAAFERFPMPRNTAIFDPTFRGDGVVRIHDVLQDPRYGKNPPYYGMPEGHLPVRSYLAVPVISRAGDVLGGLFFGHGEPGRFAERAERLVVGIAAQAAVALDNAHLYRSVQDAVRVRDEFLAAASHDLKNPLGAIKGIAQILGRRVERLDVLERAALVDGLSRIDTTVNRMARLIDTLLDVTRIQMGQPLPLDRAPVDLVALARQIVDDQQPAAPRHRLRLDATPAKLVGVWDAGRLERMVGNLVSNAVKYSPEGGAVAVTIRQATANDRAWAVLAVRDRGVGIPAGDLPRIFERFQRGRNVAGTIPGTGIGLAAARQVVEQHGGRITVASQEGQGTTFTVRLPLTPDLPASPQSGGTRVSPNSSPSPEPRGDNPAAEA